MLVWGLSAFGADFDLDCLDFTNADVSWATNKKPEPWEDFRDKEYKFY